MLTNTFVSVRSRRFLQERVEARAYLCTLPAFKVRSIVALSPELTLIVIFLDSLGCGFDNGATGITAAM